MLFALTANRAIAPCSKLAALDWAAHDVHLPGVGDLGADPQVFYRAMDLLVEHDEAIQEHVFDSVAGRLGLSCDVLLFDTTSTYFETADDDAFRRYGHSKDHRPDRPQAVIGLAVTKEGIPVRVWSWPGNSADSSVIKQVHADLASWRLHRVLWVGDRGFTSAENRQLLQTGGGHVLFGEKLRGGQGQRRRAGPARPLPAGRRQPPRQRGLGRRGGAAAAVHRGPQPRRGRPGRRHPRTAPAAHRGRAGGDRPQGAATRGWPRRASCWPTPP